MDVLDTPLNQAHQQGRKAEQHLNSGRYDEAVRCHQTAADLLADAMKMTTSQESLQSLQLQKDHHTRQTDIVRLRQKQTEVLTNKAPQSEVSGRWSKDFPHGVPSEDLLDMVEVGDSGALRTIQECDSLLAFLNNRHSLDYKSYEQARSLKPPAKKHVLKDESQMIEELRIHNDALRGHILDILHDKDALEDQLQHYKCENTRLHERIRELENTNRSNRTMSESMESDLEYQMPAALKMNLHDLASMDLPPLEMPKFDMDSLTITTSKENTASK